MGTVSCADTDTCTAPLCSTLFVHGGVLPEHAEYGLERINRETSEWLLGKVPDMPEFLAGRRGVVWAREYSAGMPLPLASLTPICHSLASPADARRPSIAHPVRVLRSQECPPPPHPWGLDVIAQRAWHAA